MSRETEKVLKELQKFLDAHAEDAADEADVDALTERFFAEYNRKCNDQKDSAPETSDDYLDLAEQATSKKKCVEYLHKALALEPDNLDARLQLITRTTISRRLVIRLVGQYPYHIHDRKEPFFFFSVPCSTDALIFKKLNLIILSHLTSS